MTAPTALDVWSSSPTAPGTPTARHRLVDTIRAGAETAVLDLQADRLTCPLTTPRPARAFDDEAEPAYIEACNALGWAPWDGDKPEPVHYPLRSLDELPADVTGPATLAIDMSALLTDDEDRAELAAAWDALDDDPADALDEALTPSPELAHFLETGEIPVRDEAVQA